MMDTQKAIAVAIGPKVYVGGKLITEYSPMSDDYAYTHAAEFAENYNRERREAAKRQEGE